MIHDLARTLELGGYTFPTREDYLTRYAAGRSVDEISADTITTIQSDWHIRGQNGCVFAMHAARSLSARQWRHEVLFDHRDARRIRTLITRSVADPGNDVLSLIFPQVTTPEHVQVLVRSALEAGCHLAPDDPAEGSGLIALRYRLGAADSWIVGFAPLPNLPATRRAPFTELAIRTKTKDRPTHPDLNKDAGQAHLADINLDYPPDVVHLLINKTRTRTTKILGGTQRRSQMKAAKARTTFALPVDIARHSKEEFMEEVEKRTGLALKAALILKGRVEDSFERRSVANRTVVVKVDKEDFSPDPDALLDIKAKLIGDRTLLSVKYGNWHTDSVRREHEVRFERDDLGNLFAILKLLGHSRFIVLSSIRTTWSGDGVVITLDEYPKLGKALFEVELADAEQGEEVIDAVFARLGVTPMDSRQTVEFIAGLNQAEEAQVDLGRIAPQELAKELVGSH
ncbi:hypothetical protein [Actinomadura terrae]|uniref:hypothetical protein n=1 Tax=Actinomadura terrae TaxID=604353 RepID=UPI001FA7D988|nr:hypothetical protein [Actinomadura terrae]